MSWSCFEFWNIKKHVFEQLLEFGKTWKRSFQALFKFDKIEKHLFELFFSLNKKWRKRFRADFEFENTWISRFWAGLDFDKIEKTLELFLSVKKLKNTLRAVFVFSQALEVIIASKRSERDCMGPDRKNMIGIGWRIYELVYEIFFLASMDVNSLSKNRKHKIWDVGEEIDFWVDFTIFWSIFSSFGFDDFLLLPLRWELWQLLVK